MVFQLRQRGTRTLPKLEGKRNTKDHGMNEAHQTARKTRGYNHLLGRANELLLYAPGRWRGRKSYSYTCLAESNERKNTCFRSRLKCSDKNKENHISLIKRSPTDMYTVYRYTVPKRVQLLCSVLHAYVDDKSSLNFFTTKEFTFTVAQNGARENARCSAMRCTRFVSRLCPVRST